MWTCPKCGREFKRNNQGHYCGKAPETIDEYISLQNEEVQLLLNELRNIVHQSIPEAEERIAWSMPTYWKQGNVIQFAACRNHISYYVGTEAIEVFKDRLTELKTNKGTVYIPYNKELPCELIADIAKWCYDSVAQKMN